MKYAIIKVINGNYFIHAEGIIDIAQAKTIYHDVCKTLWNSADVITAHVMITNEQLEIVEGYKEFIYHNSTNAEAND